MKHVIAFLLVVGVPCSAYAHLPRPLYAFAAADAVTVYGDRVVFGDLSPTAPRAYLEIDIAPAPTPGRKTIISRDAVRSALRRAGADEALANGLPAQHTIARAAVDLNAEQLRQEVLAALAPQLPLGVDVGEVLGLAALTLPTGTVRVDVRLGPLRRSVRASVLVHVDERLVARQTATINLTGTPQTPTLRGDLPRGAMVSPADVELAPTELERLPSGAVTRPADLVGKRLVQPAFAGRPVQARALETPPAVERGNAIHVVFVSRGLRISRTATADESGNIGDTIRLRSESGEMLRGVIHSASEVRVSLGGAP